MKHLLFFIYSFLFAATVFSQSVDTVTNYKWKDSAWQDSSRSIYSYNSSCLADSVLVQKWQKNSSSWINDALLIYTYNTNNLITELLTQNWNKNTGNWVDISRLTYSYNTDNLISGLLIETWNKKSSSWENLVRETRSYNSDNLADSSITEIWFVNTWQNNTLVLYTYNSGDTTVSQRIRQIWNIISASWDNQSRNAYTYNSLGQELTDTTQKWDINNQWNNFELTINTYDGNNHLINSLTQGWNETLSQWENESQVNYTYNGDGTLAELISQTWDSRTSTWVNEARSTFSYSAGCTLPLTLLNFTAVLNGKTVQLQWTTVTESNTKNFVVQRSTDGVHFTNIGSENAAGNSTQKITYQFNDETALNTSANKLYYRLQMVDKDGRFTNSKIAFVSVTPAGKLFVIYPNPAKDKLFVVSGNSISKAEIRITDQTGKLVQKQQLGNIQAGVENTINVASLNKGIYYLQFVTGSDVQTMKFFKY